MTLALRDAINRYRESDDPPAPMTLGELLKQRAQQMRDDADACEALEAALTDEVLGMPLEMFDRMLQS